MHLIDSVGKYVFFCENSVRVFYEENYGVYNEEMFIV